MSYTLKSTGIATDLTACLAVDDDGSTPGVFGVFAHDCAPIAGLGGGVAILGWTGAGVAAGVSYWLKQPWVASSKSMRR